jgi:hypothetical protein
MAMTLLQALLKNESGGRNIPNVHQGTSSGQAQGYFQITTGTWREFAQQAGIDTNKYPTPMSAPYAVQAQVAGAIPLKRWDESTVALMRGTGRSIDRNRTLAENLSALRREPAARGQRSAAAAVFSWRRRQARWDRGAAELAGGARQGHR